MNRLRFKECYIISLLRNYINNRKRPQSAHIAVFHFLVSLVIVIVVIHQICFVMSRAFSGSNHLIVIKGAISAKFPRDTGFKREAVYWSLKCFTNNQEIQSYCAG